MEDIIKKIIKKYNKNLHKKNNYNFIIYNSILKESCDYIKNIEQENKNLSYEIKRIISYLEKYYRPNEMINAIFIITNNKIIEKQLDVADLTILLNMKYKKISYY
jgi:hypothetical protein